VLLGSVTATGGSPTRLYDRVGSGTTHDFFSPVVSPDGTLFARVEDTPTSRRIVVRKRSDASLVHVFRDVEAARHVQWFPDSKTLFYETPGSGGFEFWTADSSDGTTTRLLAIGEGTVLNSATLSPDGAEVLFFKDGVHHGDMFEVASFRTPLHERAAMAWSPDGTHVAFVATLQRHRSATNLVVSDTFTGLFTADFDGNVTMLYAQDSGAYSVNPINFHFSPNGEQVAFSMYVHSESRGHNTPHVFTSNVAGGRPTKLYPGSIIELVPFVEGTAEVEVLGPDGIGITVAAGLTPPSVLVTFPNGGETLRDSSVSVTREASVPDGDDLSFDVLYSRDGASWSTVAVNVTENHTVIDSINLPASDAAKFRVIGSDGINTSHDASDPRRHLRGRHPSGRALRRGNPSDESGQRGGPRDRRRRRDLRGDRARRVDPR